MVMREDVAHDIFLIIVTALFIIMVTGVGVPAVGENIVVIPG